MRHDVCRIDLPGHTILDVTPVEGLIASTVPEVRRLINLLILTRPTNISHALRWSLWRRRRQAQARTSHYKAPQLLELSH